MRTKSLDNYFLIIGSYAIDLRKNRGYVYIYVTDKDTQSKELLFNLDLKLISSNVDTATAINVLSILRRNYNLLSFRAGELQ